MYKMKLSILDAKINLKNSVSYLHHIQSTLSRKITIINVSIILLKNH